jgi:hypothetical protein
MKTLNRLAALVCILLALTLFLPRPAAAQNTYYYFQLVQKAVHVFWNRDGTLSLTYIYDFDNPYGGPIEYVDVAMPNSNFDTSSVQADVNGRAITYISTSEFQGDGTGFALGLGANSIPTGSQGRVTVSIQGIRGVLYYNRDDNTYASAVFAPNTFYSSSVYGTTNMIVVFHLPPGVQPEEPKYYEAPPGFNTPPIAGFDDQDRITYTWINESASASESYLFGASFPVRYVPVETIQRENPFAWISEFFSGLDPELLIPFGFIGFWIFATAIGFYSSHRRKLQYLPPRISIEGHGIKRGLTAVEAAILLEQPLDKVLTMILFGVLKKEAAQVLDSQKMLIKTADPLPEGLHAYEKEFLDAFAKEGNARQSSLRSMVINLVNSVAAKMKGFSRRETVDYYQSIMKRAWEQVEAAQTPEVKSQKFDELMEWTMLDRNYDDRTREVFRTTPVFIPRWYGRFNPTYAAPSPMGSPSTSRSIGGPSLPHLPGADFAASIVTGVQNFSGGVIGNLSQFTSGVTNKTNPVPVSTSSGSGRSAGGGGRSCACACACAGCACACAGGGR